MKSVLTPYDRQKTQLAVLGMVVQALYTVQVIQNVLHYGTTWNVVLEQYGRHNGTH
jgi:hypothetical protein